MKLYKYKRMSNVIKWLESKEGEKWSRAAHRTVNYHPLVEEFDDLPTGHYRGAMFLNDNGEKYTDEPCQCIGGDYIRHGNEAWFFTPNAIVPDEVDDIPYDPSWWFHETM